MGLFVAALGSDLALLDVQSDSYLAIRDAVVDVGNGGPSDGSLALVPEATRALLEAGLFVDGDPPEANTVHELRGHPCRSDLSVGRFGPGDVLDLLMAASGTYARLRRRRPCSLYSAGRSPERFENSAALPAILATLRALRLALPLPMRCLPASLITCIFLRRKGIDAEIVFAVRSHPFEAHCWVEHDGAVIDDEVDRLRAFTTIAVGHL